MGQLSAISVVAEKKGWTKARLKEFNDATLNPTNLARHRDNVSYRTLLHEFERRGAPRPGVVSRLRGSSRLSSTGLDQAEDS